MTSAGRHLREAAVALSIVYFWYATLWVSEGEITPWVYALGIVVLLIGVSVAYREGKKFRQTLP